MLTMELVYLLDIAEDHVALSPERLRNVLSHQLRNIILRWRKTSRYGKIKRNPYALEYSQSETVTSIMYSRDLT